MAYTAPASYRLGWWAKEIVNGPDAVLMLLGNSLACDTASTPSIGRGIQRTWRPPVWSGRGTRVLNGPGIWSSQTTTQGVGTVTSLTKSSAWGGTGGTGKFPVTCYSLFTTFNLSGNTIMRNALSDPRKTGVESGAFDWADGVQMRGRLLYHANEDAEAVGVGDGSNAGTGMLAWSAIGTRGTLGSESTVGSTKVDSDASVGAGLAQTKYVDVDCGAGAGLPGIRITDKTGATEQYKWALWGAAMYYRGATDGVREPGFVLYDMATGGDNSEDIRALFQDSVIPLAYTIAYMNAMFWPTHVLVYAPFQNQTGAEGTDFGTGSYAVAKTNLLGIIDDFFAACDSAGKPRPKICIDVGHHTGYTATDMELRAKACYEVARERGCAFHNTFAKAAQNPSGSTAWFTNPTTDDVHFGLANTTEACGNGESYVAGVMWGSMVEAVSSTAQLRPRLRRRAMESI